MEKIDLNSSRSNRYKMEEVREGQLTVGELVEKLKKLLEKNPEAAKWGINHVEFGGITPSFNLDIDEDYQRITISD